MKSFLLLWFIFSMFFTAIPVYATGLKVNNFNSRVLCILKNLHKTEASQAVIQALKEYQPKRYKVPDSMKLSEIEKHYSQFLVSSKRKNTTIMAQLDGSNYEYFEDALEHSDSLFYLSVEVPLKAQVKVWNQLDTLEKKILIEELVETLQASPYDYDIIADIVDIESKLILEKLLKKMNGEAVYSPQLFFKGACNSIKTGVCRHHSTYLVALLIELGVPQNHLRLIGLEGHMVMGILIEGSSGRWHYYDPTAISSNYYTHEFQLPSVFEELELLPLDF